MDNNESVEKTGNHTDIKSKKFRQDAEGPSLAELEEAEQDAADPTHEKEIPKRQS